MPITVSLRHYGPATPVQPGLYQWTLYLDGEWRESPSITITVPTTLGQLAETLKKQTTLTDAPILDLVLTQR